MLNPLIRLTFLATIWSKYQFNIKQFLLAAILLVVVQFIYLDVAEYLQSTQANSYLLIALVSKWLLNGAILLLCWFRIRQHHKQKKAPADKKSARRDTSQRQADSTPPANDPFARIREKKTLRSRGDVLIDKKPKR